MSQVILLSSPVAGHPLTASKCPTPGDTFVQELATTLDPVEAAIAHHSSRVETFLPYELRALEHGLATAVRSWEVETLALENRTFPVIKSLLNKVRFPKCPCSICYNSVLIHALVQCADSQVVWVVWCSCQGTSWAR